MKRLGDFLQVGTIGWVDHSISPYAQPKPANKKLSLYDRLGIELERISAIEPVEISEFAKLAKTLQDKFHKDISNLYEDYRIEAKKLIPETYEIKSVLHEQEEHRPFKAPLHINGKNEIALLDYNERFQGKSTPIFISLGVYDADGVFLYYYATFCCIIDANCELQKIVFTYFE